MHEHGVHDAQPAHEKIVESHMQRAAMHEHELVTGHGDTQVQTLRDEILDIILERRIRVVEEVEARIDDALIVNAWRTTEGLHYVLDDRVLPVPIILPPSQWCLRYSDETLGLSGENDLRIIIYDDFLYIFAQIPEIGVDSFLCHFAAVLVHLSPTKTILVDIPCVDKNANGVGLRKRLYPVSKRHVVETRSNVPSQD
jgi:hypothetical protein